MSRHSHFGVLLGSGNSNRRIGGVFTVRLRDQGNFGKSRVDSSCLAGVEPTTVEVDVTVATGPYVRPPSDSGPSVQKLTVSTWELGTSVSQVQGSAVDGVKPYLSSVSSLGSSLPEEETLSQADRDRDRDLYRTIPRRSPTVGLPGVALHRVGSTDNPSPSHRGIGSIRVGQLGLWEVGLSTKSGWATGFVRVEPGL